MKFCIIRTLNCWREFVNSQQRFKSIQFNRVIQIGDLPDSIPCICVSREWLEKNEWWVHNLFICERELGGVSL